ncbi:hypothetical protein Hamer_G000232, partial [Homarus americanus]
KMESLDNFIISYQIRFSHLCLKSAVELLYSKAEPLVSHASNGGWNSSGYFLKLRRLIYCLNASTLLQESLSSRLSPFLVV